MADIASQKLIRCFLSSLGGSETVRYIEFELFKLWQYMMITKHGFQISDMTCACGSMNNNFRKKKVCTAAAARSRMSAGSLFPFYKENGFTHITNRYVPVEETERMRGILLTHAPTDLVTSSQ